MKNYLIDKKLLKNKDIKNRIKELADKINKDYKGEEEIVFLGVLRGCVFFFSELLLHIKVPLKFDFIRVSSYSGTKSTGKVKIIHDTLINLKDKNIIIVEDILDSGRTLDFLIKKYKKEGAKSVKVATLIKKNTKRIINIRPNYNGFSIPDYFIVGFGMDVDDRFRNLKDIVTIKEELIGE